MLAAAPCLLIHVILQLYLHDVVPELQELQMAAAALPAAPLKSRKQTEKAAALASKDHLIDTCCSFAIAE